MNMTKNSFWIGLILSPVIILLYWIIQYNYSGNGQTGSQQTIIPFDFVPTIPPVSLTDTPFTFVSTEDNSSKEVRLKEFAGKPTIIHIWATWCDACVNEMPELDEFAQKYSEDFNVVVIAREQTGWNAVKDFYKSKNIKNLKIYVDTKGNFTHGLKIKALPTTVFVNKQGLEIGRVLGPVGWSGDAGKVIHTNFKG